MTERAPTSPPPDAEDELRIPGFDRDSADVGFFDQPAEDELRIPGFYGDSADVGFFDQPAEEEPEAVDFGQEDFIDPATRKIEESNASAFLAKFRELRTDVREGAAGALNTVESSIALGKNILSSPKNVVLNWRRERAENKLNRISRKLDRSRFTFINERRHRKAQKALGKLETRNEKLFEHSTMMQGRVDKVSQKDAERLEAIDIRRQEIIEARIAAVERKLLRRERLRQRQGLEARGERQSFRERETVIEAVLAQPQFRRRIRAEAIRIIQTQGNRTEGN